MITLVFVDFEIGVSYDMSHQFHKKQGWGLILAAHIFLTKNVSNLMPSYLCLSTVATDFSWQCFSHLGGLIFMPVPLKYQTIIFTNPGIYLINILPFTACRGNYQDNIKFPSRYFQNTIKLSERIVIFIKTL